MVTNRKRSVTVHKPVIFGKHCLLERVSVGGMAEVYRAKPFNAPNFKRFLAVKRILPNLAEDDEFITMFIDEAKIAVQLNHRNICQIYELGKLNQSYYIVMEFIAGKDLLAIQNYFRRNRRIMSVSQAAYIISQMCDGLDYAHRKVDDSGRKMSIVHRDISPQNCLVAYDGEIKVIDFGIARAATKNTQTQVGVLKGKFGYMSPEQVTGKMLDQRSDVFAIGALFWELLTARRLFHGETDFATLEKVRNADVDPPSTKNSKIPPEIDRIVMKALTRDRDERYQWCSEMARDLRRFLDKVRPKYTRKTLSSWMVTAFSEDLGKERAKVEDFSQFITMDDVRSYNDRMLDNDDILELDPDDMEEATMVYESDIEDIESENSVVLAANELEPLPTVVMQDRSDYGLPDDAPGSTDRFVDTNRFSTTSIRAQKSMGRREWMLVALVVVLLAGAGALAMFAFGGAEDEPVTGDISVNVVPGDGVVVSVNGVAQEGSPPMTVTGLEPGPYFVQLEHPDYETLLEQVTVSAGNSLDFTRSLVPLDGEGIAVVLLPEEHPDAEVYIDGELMPGTGTERRIPVASRVDHIVEVYKPGYFVEEFTFSVRTNREFSREVVLLEVTGTISLMSIPGGTAFLDGEEQGNTSSLLTIEGLDPRGVFDLEVEPPSRSYRQHEQTIVFNGAYNLRLNPRLPRITDDDNDDELEFGYLTTGADEQWWRIEVDDNDTGFVTPLTEDTRLPLTAGEHVITFRRAGEVRTVTIEVVDGETTLAEIPASP